MSIYPDRAAMEAGQTLLIDKPLQWTSFDVVAKIRNTSKVKKIGHAGTLDPLATGLLILCTGKATKTIADLQVQDKSYTLTFCLGAITASYDAEMPPTNFIDPSSIQPQQVALAMQSFWGLQQQIPPAFSAIKKNGKPAYLAARKGIDIKLEPREIRIDTFELTHWESPQEVHAKVVCSKGTYIRSLVHDLGQLLGCGAYLTGLRRTHIGEYSVENAFNLENFILSLKSENIPEQIQDNSLNIL